MQSPCLIPDQLPEGLDLCVFDWAVNSGTGRAAKKLQAMIGTVVDGGIGPNTLRAVKMYCDTEGIEAAISDYTKIRQDFYESLSTFDTFGRGQNSHDHRIDASLVPYRQECDVRHP